MIVSISGIDPVFLAGLTRGSGEKKQSIRGLLLLTHFGRYIG